MATFIVSFGNSTKYRLNLCCEHSPKLHSLKEEIRDYLVRNFPTLDATRFYDKMTVVEVTPENEQEYKDYPEFNADSVEEIKKVLSTEVKDDESLDVLNRNAPFDNI